MFPIQPFYSLVQKFHLKFVPCDKRPDRLTYFGNFSTTKDSRSNQTMVFAHFTLTSNRDASEGFKATVSVNYKSHHGLPLTVVNISQLLYRLPEINYVLSFPAVPRYVTVNVYEVRKVYEEDVLRYTDDRAPYAWKQEDTQALVQAYLAEKDHDCLQVRVSLDCPLAHRRIVVPCRGVLCHHAQCFDAFAYLGYNEATLEPSWLCPVCSGQVFAQDIRVDLLTLGILTEADDTCTAANLRADGSWEPVDSAAQTEAGREDRSSMY